MKNKIISIKTKKSNTKLSFILSFLFSGLGEIYNGKLSHGISIFLVKISLILIITLKTITSHEFSSITPIIVIFLIYIFFTIYSPIHAYLLSKKNKDIPIKLYHKGYFYILFMFLSISTLLASLIIVVSFYDLKTTKNTNIFHQYKMNSFLFIKKYPLNKIQVGNLIITKSQKISRIIAQENDSVSYYKGKFIINNQALSYENAVNSNNNYYDSFENTVTEINKNKKYIVVNKKNYTGIKKQRFPKIKKNKFLISFDKRDEKDFLSIINTKDIYGIVEIITIPNIFERINRYVLD